MKKFQVLVTGQEERDYEIYITVEAKDKEEAERIAINEAEDTGEEDWQIISQTDIINIQVEDVLEVDES